jgi:hypothetical protein
MPDRFIAPWRKLASFPVASRTAAISNQPGQQQKSARTLKTQAKIDQKPCRH